MTQQLSDAQQAIRDGQRELCEQFAIGGDRWSVERPAGDEITEPTTITPNDEPITGYARRSQATTANTDTGTPVAVEYWRFFEFDPQNIAVGDLITSQADPRVKFTIGEPTYCPGYTTYKIRPIR